MQHKWPKMPLSQSENHHGAACLDGDASGALTSSGLRGRRCGGDTVQKALDRRNKTGRRAATLKTTPRLLTAAEAVNGAD